MHGRFRIGKQWATSPQNFQRLREFCAASDDAENAFQPGRFTPVVDVPAPVVHHGVTESRRLSPTLPPLPDSVTRYTPDVPRIIWQLHQETEGSVPLRYLLVSFGIALAQRFHPDASQRWWMGLSVPKTVRSVVRSLGQGSESNLRFIGSQGLGELGLAIAERSAAFTAPVFLRPAAEVIHGVTADWWHPFTPRDERWLLVAGVQLGHTRPLGQVFLSESAPPPCTRDELVLIGLVRGALKSGSPEEAFRRLVPIFNFRGLPVTQVPVPPAGDVSLRRVATELGMYGYKPSTQHTDDRTKVSGIAQIHAQVSAGRAVVVPEQGKESRLVKRASVPPLSYVCSHRSPVRTVRIAVHRADGSLRRDMPHVVVPAAPLPYGGHPGPPG